MPNQTTIPPTAKNSSTWVTMTAVAVALGSGLYLVNPGFGLFEFLPDNLPVIGNIDEVVMTTAFLWSLATLGFKLPGPLARIFPRRN
ncbi:MAG: DUF1232 domain-containing protein [Planctomycetota bacterium]|nr:DUF1232 domain-containing protein [Planctomycetota bacterium]